MHKPLVDLLEVDVVPAEDEFEELLLMEREDGCSLIHGGSPLLENSLRRRNEMVSRMIEALSSCEVMAGGSGNI